MSQRKEYNRVLCVGSIYTLLLYLLYSSKEEVEDTFFFFTDPVTAQIGERLKSSYYFSVSKHKKRKPFISRLGIRLSAPFRWPFLRSAEIFGQDQFFFVSPLIGSRGMTIIEDGTAFYDSSLMTPDKVSIFKQLVYGSRVKEPKLGASARDKKVILTGLAPTPKEVENKVEIINIKALWESKSAEEKEWILSVYGVNLEMLECLRSKSAILVIQPLERDHVPEDIIIEVYRKITKDVDPKDLVIKLHPGSKVDYQKYFPDAFIFKEKVPMEIFSLIGIEFKDAYTISSTAALSMPKGTNIHFVGSSIHPIVEQAIGKIEYSDFVK